VFDPFRGGAGAHEGPGLGLAACHEVVAALGGRIEVESEPGRGTVFRVLLPGATRSAPSYVG
jgi:signal transduction histidine kinase